MRPTDLRDYAIVGLLLGTWAAIGVPYLAARAIRQEVCRHVR